MPGGDLLFHRLSDSTIGAEGFHVRVRDGIGWFTDAMATRQWSLHMCLPRPVSGGGRRVQIDALYVWLRVNHPASNAVVGGVCSQARIGRLVSVSFTRYRASTSDLSRSWSPTVL